MWDLKCHFARGRVSVRKFFPAVTALLVALFVTVTPLTQSVFAAEESAARTSDGQTVTYQSHTYTRLTKDQIPPTLLESTSIGSPDGYGYFDTAAHKAYLILTAGDSTTASNGNYVVYDFNPPNDYKNGTTPQSVTLKTDNTRDGGLGQSNCNNSATGAIGWIICPVVTFLARGLDVVYNITAQFLEVRTITADTNSSLFHMWSFIRDIANICFVIVFLVIVYSQITNLGISNYGIKHMLPRLIVGAILVNLSYWIGALCVDISNILGQSVHDMFVAIMANFNTGAKYGNSTNIPDWGTVAGTILAGGGVVYGATVVAADGALYMLIPMLLSAAVAILVALVIMAARQALIVILLIISPLAFVAYILPNTEKYFKKWSEAFMTLLLLFPIFSAVFSGAQLAGLAIVQNANNNIIIIILGMAVQVAPLFITPILLKFSGGVLNKVAGIVNDPHKGLIDKSRNWATNRAQQHKNKVLAEHNNKRNLHRFNPGRRTVVGLDRHRRWMDGRGKYLETQAQNSFDATEKGQRLMELNKTASLDKQDNENVFGATVAGRSLEMRAHELNAVKQLNENTYESDWNTAIQTNTRLRRLDIDVQQSEVQAARAKGQVEAMRAEVAASGEVFRVRGTTDEDYEHMIEVARSIKSDSLQTQLTAFSKNQADRHLTEERAKILKETAKALETGENPENIYTVQLANGDIKNAVEVAGGIMGKVGQRSVVAQARSEASKFLLDDAKNIEATLDYDISSNPAEVLKKFMQAETDAERVAYTSILGKRGAPGAERLDKVFQEMQDRFDRGDITREAFLDFKELTIAQNSAILGMGKNFEFFLTNSAHGYDDPDPALAGKIKSWREINNDVSTWGNLSADAFSKMNIIEQFQGLKVLAHKAPEKYMSLVREVLSSDNARANMKVEVVKAIAKTDAEGRLRRDAEGNIVIVSPDDTSWKTNQNTPSVEELTPFEQHVMNEPARTAFDPRPDVDVPPGEENTAAYWRSQYEKARRKTETLLSNAEARGIDLTRRPD